MITVTVNSEQKTLVEGCNLTEAIRLWKPGAQAFAIAVNGYFIPNSNYADTRLQNGDRVELLVPMQGG